jgi:hypothetical protein
MHWQAQLTNEPTSFHRREVLRTLVGGSLLMPGILSKLLAESGSAAAGPTRAETATLPGEGEARDLHLLKWWRLADGYLRSEAGALCCGWQKVRDRRRVVESAKGVAQAALAVSAPAGSAAPWLAISFRTCASAWMTSVLIRSMKGEDNEHYQATLGMHTGSFFFSRPSIGSWVSYGLGTMNANLPSFVTLAPQMPYAGTQIFNNDFLPAYHQGVRVIGGKEPIANLDRRSKEAGLQELELELADVLNNRHLRSRAGDTDLAARIRTFETAFHMQTDAREVFELEKESDATLALYGLKRGQSEGFGWQCLVARRLAERGVRFIELVDGSSSNNWDQHGDMAEHAGHAKNIDQPIAGLLRDLKARGLLDDTLVVWTYRIRPHAWCGRNQGPRPSQRVFLIVACWWRSEGRTRLRRDR